jgi:nitrite reductase (NADH) large subunit
VIDDYLGLAEQLEVQMQDLVDGYQCEWKATLEDPQARARFKPFVNSDATDASIQMHSVRGQTSPAPIVAPLAAPAPRGRHQLINLEQIS